MPTEQIWSCKIGSTEDRDLPSGADWPMRRAIEKAYYDLTGKMPDFIFSGWGAELDEGEKYVLEHPSGSIEQETKDV